MRFLMKIEFYVSATELGDTFYILYNNLNLIMLTLLDPSVKIIRIMNRC
jgi:hypothetical protein